MIVLTDKQKEIAAILIECAKEGKLITFGEIEARTGINRHRVGIEAGVVSKKCIELGLPKLSVLIVYKASKITGDGYFREFYSMINNKAQRIHQKYLKLNLLHTEKSQPRLRLFYVLYALLFR